MELAQSFWVFILCATASCFFPVAYIWWSSAYILRFLSGIGMTCHFGTNSPEGDRKTSRLRTAKYHPVPVTCHVFYWPLVQPGAGPWPRLTFKKRFRISSHQLRIETGRYENTPRNERLCLFCTSNKIEDENHFLLDCKTYHWSDQSHIFLQTRN